MTAIHAADPLPTLYIPHGGGPCFFMEWTMGPRDMWDNMAAWLRDLAREVGVQPRAILVVSAHWEEDRFTLLTGARPPLYYDYYGFPEHTYRLSYPAPGAPDVAARALSLLAEAGVPVAGDAARGFDHGVFVPFKLIYPEGNIPITQLSLTGDLDPARHLAAGRALAPLRKEGVLIVGSGASYHNMRERRPEVAIPAAEAFDAWLTEAAHALPEERWSRLAAWAAAPGARVAHPREEHLIPLMVAAGAAADDRGMRIYNERLAGAAPVSGFRFG